MGPLSSEDQSFGLSTLVTVLRVGIRGLLSGLAKDETWSGEMGIMCLSL